MWHKVVEIQAIPEAELASYTVVGTQIVLLKRGADIRCFADYCTHQDIPLSDFGEVESGEIVCYAHGARFDAQSGSPLCFPAKEALKSFQVKVESGFVYVNLNL